MSERQSLSHPDQISRPLPLLIPDLPGRPFDPARRIPGLRGGSRIGRLLPLVQPFHKDVSLLLQRPVSFFLIFEFGTFLLVRPGSRSRVLRSFLSRERPLVPQRAFPGDVSPAFPWLAHLLNGFLRRPAGRLRLAGVFNRRLFAQRVRIRNKTGPVRPQDEPSGEGRLGHDLRHGRPTASREQENEQKDRDPRSYPVPSTQRVCPLLRIHTTLQCPFSEHTDIRSRQGRGLSIPRASSRTPGAAVAIPTESHYRES